VSLNWKRVLPVWWSFFWRGSIYGVIGSLALGALFGALAGVTGHLDQAGFYGGVGASVAGIPASMLALKQTLNVHLGSLISLARSAGASPVV
jgi:hypothetical protein